MNTRVITDAHIGCAAMTIEEVAPAAAAALAALSVDQLLAAPAGAALAAIDVVVAAGEPQTVAVRLLIGSRPAWSLNSDLWVSLIVARLGTNRRAQQSCPR